MCHVHLLNDPYVDICSHNVQVRPGFCVPEIMSFGGEGEHQAQNKDLFKMLVGAVTKYHVVQRVITNYYSKNQITISWIANDNLGKVYFLQAFCELC